MTKKTITLITIIACIAFCFTPIAYLNRNNFLDIYKYSRAVFSKYGSTGQEVISIQKKLTSLGFYKGSLDGKYGYQTYVAVKAFQAKRGLTADGIAGSQTLAALGISSSSSTSSANTSYNVNLLAHLAYAEARGEPYSGQVAVCSVVINRTKDSRFPSTIPSVIYQPGAFEPVGNGQINLTPDTTSINAARDALNGWDPSSGSLFFYNPATTTNAWMLAKAIIIRIGRHVFTK